MKRLKSLKFNIFLPIVWLLIAVIVMLWVWSLLLPLYYNDEPAFVYAADEWIQTLNARGLKGLTDEVDLTAACDDHLGENGNIILLGRDGKILFAANKTYIQDADHLNLLISPYEGTRRDWTIKQYPFDGNEAYQLTRLALLLDDGGEVVMPVRAVFSNSDQAVGTANPKFSQYFPTLNKQYYDNAVYYYDRNDQSFGSEYANIEPSIAYGDIWAYDDGVLPAPVTDTAGVRKVQEYLEWENAQMSRGGDLRLVYRGPAWDGTQLLMLYQNSDDIYASQIRYYRTYRTRDNIMIGIAWCLALLLIALAGWVYMDADKRNFRPAFWGVLTLIGNGITWIIYMIVRPNGRLAKGCPGCRAPIRGGYAYCPVCGAALREKCAACSHVLEPSWHYCPDCGHAIDVPSDEWIGETAPRSFGPVDEQAD